jgi:hypothetical protein
VQLQREPTKQLVDGEDYRLRPRRHPSVCLAIPALIASLGSIADTLNYNWDCAYVNDFPSWLIIIAQEAVRRMRRHLFGLKGFMGFEPRLFTFKLKVM